MTTIKSTHAELTEQDAEMLEQGASMLEALSNDERNRGNCSTAEGAACSAHAVRRLASALLAANVTPMDMVQVCRADANNYCRILRHLGMEEEGDPVVEVKRLLPRITWLEAQLEAVGAGGVGAPVTDATAYLCNAWGESDMPCVAIVHDLEGVRRFLLDQWLGDEDDRDASGESTLSNVMAEIDGRDWLDEGAWSAEFEIGGISVDQVFDVGHSIDANRAPVDMPVPAVVAPDWYHAECDDPDRSGFYREKSDAQTQVNDHGGSVTDLFAAPKPQQIAEPGSQVKQKPTGKWESARVADYNQGWNDCFFATSIERAAATPKEPS